ncbi:hypothetical protein GCM10010266_72260 [Streptomyces griseomycini]|nr:hypothetical protein GCM10010266_72260 [Streptomyces griseomycini]GGR61382.1 hypothetical protein GCM10015536_76690 [Streptomyces griseomycini]
MPPGSVQRPGAAVAGSRARPPPRSPSQADADDTVCTMDREFLSPNRIRAWPRYETARTEIGGGTRWGTGAVGRLRDRLPGQAFEELPGAS